MIGLEHEWDVKSVEFPVTEDSLVVEIGGYEGRWALEMCKRYNPRMLVYEPQDWAFMKCKEALKEYHPKAIVLNFGLGTKTAWMEMGQWGTDGSSFIHIDATKPTGESRTVDAAQALHSCGEIDVMLMNIEGYEFQLIPYLVEKGIMKRVKYFMCQFHTFEDADEAKYLALRELLGKTMAVEWDYGKVLTCWRQV